MSTPLTPTRHETLVALYVAAGFDSNHAEKIAEVTLRGNSAVALAESDVRDIVNEEIAARLPAPLPQPTGWRRFVPQAATITLVGVIITLAGVAYKSTMDERALLAMIEKNDVSTWRTLMDRPGNEAIDEKIATAIAGIPPTVVPTIPEGTAFAIAYVDQIDIDGDGVFGGSDDCPDIVGVQDNGGCPAIVDTDGDGVVDYLDRCVTPEAEKATVVNDEIDEGYVWAKDIAGDPDNGCTDVNRDGYADARIDAIVQGGVCPVVMKTTETKAATDTELDEGTIDYDQCKLEKEVQAAVTCSYKGETPYSCKVVSVG